MDDKLFRQKLTEVSEWHIPNTLDFTLDGKRKQGRPSKDSDLNLTLAPAIIRIKTQGETCSDCLKLCEEPRTWDIKQFEELGIKHWRTRCRTCNRFKNPETGVYDLHPNASSQYFKNWCRKQRLALIKAENQSKE